MIDYTMIERQWIKRNARSIKNKKFEPEWLQETCTVCFHSCMSLVQSPRQLPPSTPIRNGGKQTYVFYQKLTGGANELNCFHFVFLSVFVSQN